MQPSPVTGELQHYVWAADKSVSVSLVEEQINFHIYFSDQLGKVPNAHTQATPACVSSSS